MFSIRNRNIELAHNSEGIFNHHRADGSNHLTVTGGEEYFNIWPTYDWQKIPGTTVLQKPKLPNQHQVQKDGLTDFVGATTDGLYGVVGFDFISPHDNIRAKKSWFFFDKEYVCMGAGIASNDFNNPVVSTIEQNLLKGDVFVSQDSIVKNIAKGEHILNKTDWVLVNNTAYVFPEPITVNLNNNKQSGSWYSINKQSSSSKETDNKDVFKLWIDHGKRPQGENLWLYPGKMETKDITYQYIVIPNARKENLIKHSTVDILVNSSKIQAVKHKKLNMIQAVFYQSGKIEIAKGIWLNMDSPGIVILHMNGNSVEEISASDPTRKIGKLHIDITGLKHIVINLPLNEMAGTSVTLQL